MVECRYSPNKLDGGPAIKGNLRGIDGHEVAAADATAVRVHDADAHRGRDGGIHR